MDVTFARARKEKMVYGSKVSLELLKIYLKIKKCGNIVARTERPSKISIMLSLSHC